MIAVMTWPAMGILDDRAREELTCENMEVIRRAIVGDPDRFDADGRRIIGGYVGDMEKWPDLWEAKAELNPCNNNPFTFGFRPAGEFIEKRWKWCRPFRKVLDGGFEYNEPDGAGYCDDNGTPTDPSDDVWHIGDYSDPNYYCDDHIGGLETENEGQPRGLWTDDPKEDVTLSEPENPDKWKGPYMAPPMDECLKDSGHWAETDGDYALLEPIDECIINPDPPPEYIRNPTWEDGDYTPSHEHFDEKESFRLLQTDGRLADGWGRAFRFFITADQDRPGSTIFWIISEGPDKEGTYPTKGTFGTTWTNNADDIMSKAYNKDDDYNKDNIVMKIYSHEWEAIFEEINEKKKAETEDLFLRIKKAILGSSPGGMNDGFTGDVCRWPKLFRWEGSFWDDEDDATSDSYTKGQLRELWTRTPNNDPVAGANDDVPVPAWGIGWRHSYFQTPWGFNGEQFIRDAWDREVLFFKNAVESDPIMILSRGADGKFDFGSTNAEKTEPVNFTETIADVITGYDPNGPGNADNIVLIVWKSEWDNGSFRLTEFTVQNAVYNDPGEKTKACLFYDNGGTEIKTAVAAGDWVAGPDPVAFNRNDVKPGARHLVFWNDTNDDGVIDSGEKQYTFIYNIITSEGCHEIDSITLDANNFTTAP